jgi:hypothetical protein
MSEIIQQISGNFGAYEPVNGSWLQAIYEATIGGLSGGGATGATGPEGPVGSTGPAGPVGATGPDFTKPFQTLTDGAGSTLEWNIANGYNAVYTLSGSSRDLVVIGATGGNYGTIIIKQNSVTASRVNITGKFAGGTYSFSGTASTDLFTFVYDGTDFYWNSNKNYF